MKPFDRISVISQCLRASEAIDDVFVEDVIAWVDSGSCDEDRSLRILAIDSVASSRSGRQAMMRPERLLKQIKFLYEFGTRTQEIGRPEIAIPDNPVESVPTTRRRRRRRGPGAAPESDGRVADS